MNVTSKDLSNIFSLTLRRVQQLTAERVIEKDAKTGKYPLAASVQRYIDYKLNAEIGEKDVDYFKERARHEKAKREKAEIVLKQIQGQVHDGSVVEAVMTEMITNAKSKLRGIPSKISPALLAQTELSVIEAKLSDAIDECLLELSDYQPALFASEDMIECDESE